MCNVKFICLILEYPVSERLEFYSSLAPESSDKQCVMYWFTQNVMMVNCIDPLLGFCKRV